MKLFEKIDKTIFGTSSIIYAFIFLFIAIVPQIAYNVISGVMNYTLSTLGWVYIVGYAAVSLFLLALAFSKYGKMKFGAPADKPEFSFFSWISMLVGAGIGCGLVYFGVCEPASHFVSSPFAESQTAAAAEVAIRTTFYHWGFLPWAIYCMVGLCIGYFSYKKGLPDLISSTFQPLLGNRIYKTPGKLIDAFSVVAIICGISMSVGFAGTQFASGLNTVYGISNNIWVTFGVVILIGILAIASALRGVEKGIKIISNVKMGLVIAFLVFTFIFGSSMFLIKTFVQSVGDMVFNLPWLMFFSDSFGGVSVNLGWDWVSGWTVFYWAWWVAFAPFVGGFLAKISRGRTIREFIIACVTVPGILCFLWFTFFGGEAIHMSLFEGSDIAVNAAADSNASMFLFLKELPISSISIPVMMVLLIILIATAVSSATYVTGGFCMGNKGTPSLGIRAFWGIFIVLNSCLFIFLGGLDTLKYTAIVLAFPFMIIIVLMIVNLLKDMRATYQKEFEAGLIPGTLHSEEVLTADKDEL
jgi:glycine betaine transporter